MLSGPSSGIQHLSRTTYCPLLTTERQRHVFTGQRPTADSEGTRQDIEECCLRYRLFRGFARTPEADTLLAILGHMDELQTKKNDMKQPGYLHATTGLNDTALTEQAGS